MTIEMLNQLRTRREEIRRLEEKEQMLRSRAEKITATLSGMPRSAQDDDKMCGIVAEILEHAERTGARALELAQQCEEAELWLDGLPEQQRRVMRLYYVDGVKTWEQVAEHVALSWRHCMRIKDAAISKMS